MTSALGKGDVKALGLQLALDLLAAQEKRDSISGLRSRTQPGRPDWAKVGDPHPTSAGIPGAREWDHGMRSETRENE